MNERTPLFLMANLGSEVSRMLSYFDKDESQEAHNALERARDILKKMREFPEMESRERELDLLEQALTESINKDSKLSINHVHLKSYFYPFVVRQMQSL